MTQQTVSHVCDELVFLQLRNQHIDRIEREIYGRAKKASVGDHMVVAEELFMLGMKRSANGLATEICRKTLATFAAANDCATPEAA